MDQEVEEFLGTDLGQRVERYLLAKWSGVLGEFVKGVGRTAAAHHALFRNALEEAMRQGIDQVEKGLSPRT